MLRVIKFYLFKNTKKLVINAAKPNYINFGGVSHPEAGIFSIGLIVMYSESSPK